MKLKSKLQTTWKKRVRPFLKDPLLLSRWVSEYSRQQESNRMTVWVNGGYKTIVGRDYGGELFMFLQDMHQGIMPFGSNRDVAYTAHLEPSDSGLEQVVTEALSNRGYRHDISEGLEDFIRKETQMLFYYTKTFFELYCDRDDEGNITRIEFYDIYPPSMKKLFGQYFQVIPWSAAKHAQIKAGIRRIPKDRILHITFPGELGGKRGLMKILKRLRTLSDPTIPKFQLEALEQNKGIGFDLDKYVRNKYIEIGQLTRKLGWNQRNRRENDLLEYYSMHRHLMFADSQATVRKHIIEKINDALSSSAINAGVKVLAENLLTNSDIKEEFEKLRNGGQEFAGIVNRTLQP